MKLYSPALLGAPPTVIYAGDGEFRELNNEIGHLMRHTKFARLSQQPMTQSAIELSQSHAILVRSHGACNGVFFLRSSF